MNAVVFVMYGPHVAACQHFDYEAEALKRLLGEPYDNFTYTYLRLMCKPPADQYHGPYLIKEIDIDEKTDWEKLRTYVNTLTPEQLEALKI
jgi:hypothetical protein